MLVKKYEKSNNKFEFTIKILNICLRTVIETKLNVILDSVAHYLMGP